MGDTDRTNNYKIGRILTSIRKFAIDSAVNISLKGTTPGGKQIHKLLQEGLEHQSQPLTSTDKKKKCEDCESSADHVQAKVEKVHEDINSAKLESSTSTKSPKGLEPSKKSDEGEKGSVSPMIDRKRVFIRSRL